jgi:hypothetical protein
MHTLSLRLWECFPPSVDQSLKDLQTDELRSIRKSQSLTRGSHLHEHIAHLCLRIRGSFHDIWYSCPSIWMILKLRQDLLCYLLLIERVIKVVRRYQSLAKDRKRRDTNVLSSRTRIEGHNDIIHESNVKFSREIQ